MHLECCAIARRRQYARLARGYLVFSPAVRLAGSPQWTESGIVGALGIRVNALCPGLIETPLTAAIAGYPPIEKQMRDWLVLRLYLPSTELGRGDAPLPRLVPTD